MRVRKVVSQPIDVKVDGIHFSGGITAAMAAAVNETGTNGLRVSSRRRIVQRNGRTEVSEHHVDTAYDQGGTS
jgi:hypothetical protein